MRVLIAHNKYVQKGGEDNVFLAEKKMLTNNGFKVEDFIVSNADTIAQGKLSTWQTLWKAPFNKAIYHEFRRQCRRFQPDIVHVHNIWFSLTPAVYTACQDEGIPVVQTLHNYFLLCINGSFLRDGKVCQLCVGRDPVPGVLHRCYKNSMLFSYFRYRMVWKNWRRNVWQRSVSAYIAITEYSRRKFIEGGLPGERVFVKPNFIDLPDDEPEEGEGGIFLGRLSQEKGLSVLLDAWKELSGIPLTVLGTGPQENKLKQFCTLHPNAPIRFLGFQPQEICYKAIRSSAFLIMPSTCIEGALPLTVLESFAHGRAVIASRLGPLAALIKDKRTGLLFEPGNAHDLACKVRWMVDHRNAYREMSQNARREYQQHYTPERNFEILNQIYHQAIEFSNRNAT